MYTEMVIHTRHSHLVESIDMSNLPSIDQVTEGGEKKSRISFRDKNCIFINDLILQVTMVGGHVVEFREDGGQIVALHTIP